MKLLDENFSLIGVFSGIKVFDSKHAYEEFVKWFPKLNKNDYKKVLQQGIDKIKKTQAQWSGQYMIISHALKIRIPLELRQDRHKNDLVGIVPTTLGELETVNLRDEIEVFVEKNKNSYRRFPIKEGFDFYAQHGVVQTNFEEIFVD